LDVSACAKSTFAAGCGAALQPEVARQIPKGMKRSDFMILWKVKVLL
jgi:hypothetical protein